MTQVYHIRFDRTPWAETATIAEACDEESRFEFEITIREKE